MLVQRRAQQVNEKKMHELLMWSFGQLDFEGSA